jgi:hypothetical protein
MLGRFGGYARTLLRPVWTEAHRLLSQIIWTCAALTSGCPPQLTPMPRSEERTVTLGLIEQPRQRSTAYQ